MNPNIPHGEVDAGNGMKSHTKSEAEMDLAITKEVNKRVDRLKDTEIDLAIRTAEARQFLADHVATIRREWIDWLEQSNKIMADLRQSRVACGFESRQLLAECGDVRKFFLSDDHEKEITKLREFVELAERLRSLKNDGTLDKLADTILRLT